MAINISWVVCVYLEIDYQEQLSYQLIECEQDSMYADNVLRFLGLGPKYKAWLVLRTLHNFIPAYLSSLISQNLQEHI